MSTPPLSMRSFLSESLILDFSVPSSPEAIRSARGVFEDVCNRFRGDGLKKRLRVRPHAHLVDASKFLHALLDHGPDEHSEDSILRVLLYSSFAAADPVAFPLPAPPSAASKTLDDMLDDIRRNSLALDDAVVIRLYDVAFDLLNCFIVQFIADGTRPVLSHSPHLGYDGDQFTKQHLNNSVQNACRERDRDTCVMTGSVDRVHLREFDELGILDEKYPNGLPQHADTEVCHIIPVPTGLSEGSHPEPERLFFWSALGMFAPTTRPYLQRLEFDTIWNVFLASVDAHNSFARLKAYFEPTETRHVYRIVALERVGPDFHSVADFSDHGTHDPPAPELFASHAALCRVLEASGAARYIRAKQEDDEHLERQGVLNTDGSTDLSSFFWRHGIPTT